MELSFLVGKPMKLISMCPFNLIDRFSACLIKLSQWKWMPDIYESVSAQCLCIKQNKVRDDTGVAFDDNDD